MSERLKLLDLPGIGSRIRERLMEHYGDEEKALHAVSSGDVASLTNALSERQALTLIQYSRGLKYDVKPDDFLATDEVAKAYQMLVSRISGYAHTEYARLKIGTIFPSYAPELIEENRSMAKAAMKTAKLLQGQGIEELLKLIKPLREKALSRVRERAVAATSVDAFQSLKARGLDKLIDLHLAESPPELMDLAKSYSHVSLVGEDVDGPEEMEHAESLEEWYLVPEAVLGFYKDNLETLLSAVELARRLKAAKVCGFEEGKNWKS